MDLSGLIQFIAGGGTPQQFLNKIPINNPMINNLMTMAKNGQSGNVETFARNFFKEQGRDFDKEFNEFRKTVKF